MRKILTTTLLSLVFTFSMLAQEIEMELYLSTPDIQGSDGGDSRFFDMDNDGDNDLIIAGANGAILTTLYRNDGEGNFTETNPGVFTGLFFTEIVISDIDNDDDIDIFMMGGTQGGANFSGLYLNNGSGTYSISTTSTFEALEGNGAEFGDIDGDGDDDLIISGFNDTNDQVTRVYSNNGQGVFTVLNTPIFNGLLGRFRFIDYDNDDDNDLIFTGKDGTETEKINLYTNNGSGTFSLFTNTGLENLAGGDIAVGDTDGDGDLDLIVCGEDSENLIKTLFYVNDGNGSFTEIENDIFNPAALGEASFNDFDNDGDLDAFVIGTGNGGLVGPDGENTILGTIYQNEGNNNFILAQEIIGGYFSHHAVADIDGDNVLDLVLGGTTVGDPTRGSFIYKNVTEVELGVNEATFNDRLIIYPNPAQNSFRVDTNENKEGVIEIYTSLGKKVLYTEITENSTKIDLDLATGTYFLKFISSTNTQTRKLIVN